MMDDGTDCRKNLSAGGGSVRDSDHLVGSRLRTALVSQPVMIGRCTVLSRCIDGDFIRNPKPTCVVPQLFCKYRVAELMIEVSAI